MSKKKEFTLAEIAHHTGSKVVGDSTAIVNNLSTLEASSFDSLSFLSNKKYSKFINASEAQAIIVHDSFEIKDDRNYIISSDPYLAYAEASNIFYQNYARKNESQETIFGKNVSIGTNTVINSNCVIGDNVIIHDNVSIYSCTKIGNNSIIHSGAVIGSDGFGYAPSKEGWHKIQHLGGVEIGNHVEIGAKSTVDRGALGNTVLEDGVKIDNHVHVAHNSYIGENTAIAGQSGMAGSVKIGKNCQIAGQVGIVGHIEIADNVIVMAKTLVTKSLKEAGVYSGVMPIQRHKDSLKFIAKIKK